MYNLLKGTKRKNAGEIAKIQCEIKVIKLCKARTKIIALG